MDNFESMPVFSTCCFCWDFSQGTLAVAFVYWISSLVILGISAEKLSLTSKALESSNERNAHLTMYSLCVILSVVLLVSSMVLFTSVTQRARYRLVPWLMVVPFWFVCVAITFLIITDPSSIAGPVCGIAFLFLLTAYSYFCIIMYYRELVAEIGVPKNYLLSPSLPTAAPLTTLITGNFESAHTAVRHSFRRSKKMVRRLSMRKPRNWANGEQTPSLGEPSTRRQRAVPVRGPIQQNNITPNGQLSQSRSPNEAETSQYNTPSGLQLNGQRRPPYGAELRPQSQSSSLHSGASQPPTYNEAIHYDRSTDDIRYGVKQSNINEARKDDRFPVLKVPEVNYSEGYSNTAYEYETDTLERRHRHDPSQNEYNNRAKHSPHDPRINDQYVHPSYTSPNEGTRTETHQTSRDNYQRQDNGSKYKDNYEGNERSHDRQHIPYDNRQPAIMQNERHDYTHRPEGSTGYEGGAKVTGRDNRHNTPDSYHDRNRKPPGDNRPENNQYRNYNTPPSRLESPQYDSKDKYYSKSQSNARMQKSYDHPSNTNNGDRRGVTLGDEAEGDFSSRAQGKPKASETFI